MPPGLCRLLSTNEEKKKKEKLPHLPKYFPFYQLRKRLEPSGLLVLEVLSLSWTPSSEKFRFPFKWQLLAFLANGNDIMSHMLTVYIGLRDTAGSTLPVRSGIRPRMCNRYSLRHCNCVNRDDSYYLPNPPCHVRGWIWAFGLPGCSDQGPGGWAWEKRPHLGQRKDKENQNCPLFFFSLTDVPSPCPSFRM